MLAALGMELHAACLHLGKVEDVVDQLQKVARAVEDVAECVDLVFGEGAELPVVE